MRFVKWPEFANRWMWLCPILAVVIAAAVLWSFGFAWWSALLAAVLLVCPVLILWVPSRSPSTNDDLGGAPAPDPDSLEECCSWTRSRRSRSGTCWPPWWA